MSSVTNDHIRSNLHRELVESGKRDQLVEVLKARLIESGWRDEMKVYTKEKLQAKEKLPSVDDTIREVSDHARATIPDNIKAELLMKISAFVEDNL